MNGLFNLYGCRPYMFPMKKISMWVNHGKSTINKYSYINISDSLMHSMGYATKNGQLGVGFNPFGKD